MKLQLFADGESPVVEQNTETQPVAKTPVQNDIESIEAAIKQLKDGGEELFKDQIAALEQKLDEAKARAEAEIEKAEETVKEAEQTFVEKYGNKIKSPLI